MEFKFETAAKAIRHSIGEFPRSSLPGTILGVNEESYHHRDIRKLYDSNAYPPRRQNKEASDATKTQL